MARKSVVESYDTDKGRRSKAPTIAVYTQWDSRDPVAPGPETTTINSAHTTTAKYHTHTQLWKCFHPSYSPLLLIRWGASQVQFVFCNEPISLANHSKRSEAMEAPQNSRFYFEFLPFGTALYVKRSTTFAKAYGFKVRCMEIMLGNTLRTWGTYWEQEYNLLGT